VIDPLGLRTRDELAAFLADKSDDDLDDMATNLGIDKVLQAVFDGMALEYVPSEGPRERVIVEWSIIGPDHRIHTWHNDISRDGFAASPSASNGEPPDVGLRVDLAPFLRLMGGTLRGIEALSAGTLKLKGNIELAMEMEAWFGLVPAPPGRSTSS
jgi:hypothetical protein